MSQSIQTFPRAGLIGNPSDGFFGRTIAFTFDRFCVDLQLTSGSTVRLFDADQVLHEFRSISVMLDYVRCHGYPKSIGLICATIKRFVEAVNLGEPSGGFTLSCRCSIPYQLGFAGSSGIIIGCLKALCGHYRVVMDKPQMANLALAIETEELGIAGGLQDRVVQVYQGLVYMDFAQTNMEQLGYGYYESLDPSSLENLYIAYRHASAESSGMFHHNLRQQFNEKRPQMLSAVEQWRDLTWRAREMIVNHNTGKLGLLMNENFDLRNGLYDINPDHLEMVMVARSVGASAKFTGSGGAIIGCYDDELMYQKLMAAFEPLGIEMFRPNIVS